VKVHHFSMADVRRCQIFQNIEAAFSALFALAGGLAPIAKTSGFGGEADCPTIDGSLVK